MEDRITQSLRETYDQIAVEYANYFFDELQDKPFDRQLLDRFVAELRPCGKVCDLGCGPGHIARYLRDTGANAFGLDLSPQMIEIARMLNPDIPFREGNMMALNIPDNVLKGIVSFYSIANLPQPFVLAASQEMIRVLLPGGMLLLAFHVGDKVLRLGTHWGQSVAIEFYLYPVDLIERYLAAVGFSIVEVLERKAYASEVEYQSGRAYILAQKPKTTALAPILTANAKHSHIRTGCNCHMRWAYGLIDR